MRIFSALHRLSTHTLLTLCGLLTISCAFLLRAHALRVEEMRGIGLPAALAVPGIDKRLEILAEQNEVTELQSALQTGGMKEFVGLYLLPEEDDIDRLLGIFDLLFGELEQKGQLSSVSSITIGTKISSEVEDVEALPLSFKADFTQEGLSEFLRFIDLSGLLTVSDVLDAQGIDRLLALTEEDNPASVIALEQFLGTDLLRYSEDPALYEGQLSKAFSSPLFAHTLRDVLQSPRARAAKEMLQSFALSLRSQNLWPVRLLTIEEVTVHQSAADHVRAEVKLRAYVRES